MALTYIEKLASLTDLTSWRKQSCKSSAPAQYTETEGTSFASPPLIPEMTLLAHCCLLWRDVEMTSRISHPLLIRTCRLRVRWLATSHTLCRHSQSIYTKEEKALWPLVTVMTSDIVIAPHVFCTSQTSVVSKDRECRQLFPPIPSQSLSQNVPPYLFLSQSGLYRI